MIYSLRGLSIPQVWLPGGWGAPLTHPVPLVPVVGNLAATIPQVQLPAGWNAPLANPVPVVPPVPQLQTRGRGRGRGMALGPLHDISGDQANPAHNNLHRGQIALRERNADYNAQIAKLQQQVEAAMHCEWEAVLRKMAEKKRVAEAAAARRRMLQQIDEEERRRKAAEAEAAIQWLAEQEKHRQAAELREMADRQAAEAEAIREIGRAHV